MIGALQLLVAAAVSLAATWPLRKLALRFGILDHPGGSSPHKTHSEPVPHLGGVAVAAGALVGLLAFHPEFRRIPALMLLIVGLGLFDDIRQAAVVTKLVGETSIAVAAVALGYVWHFTDSAPINVTVSVLWMVGLTNSFNLVDNMDGLSSAIGAVALLAFALIAPVTAPLALPLAGALIGFLVVNRPPAMMYLGDAGSLFIGFTAALVSITAANTTAGLHSLVLLVVPVALAVFDTSLVIVSRLMTGRPVQLGGRDHFSHRLSILGWSRYQILGATVLASVAGGLIAYLATQYPLGQAWLAVPLAVTYVGVWVALLRVDPYAAADSRLEVWSG